MCNSGLDVLFPVTPAQAGIHGDGMDPGLRRGDTFFFTKCLKG